MTELLTLEGSVETSRAPKGLDAKREFNQLVAVGTAIMGEPEWTYLDSLQRLETYGGYAHIKAGQADRPMPIVDAHNDIVERFLKTDRDWLLNCDMDAILHPKTLKRLMAWNVPIVGPLCFTRYTPVTPTVTRGRMKDRLFKNRLQTGWKILIDEVRQWIRGHPGLWSINPVALDPIPTNSLWQVAFTGAHAMLIRRDVLEAVDPPWFERTTPLGQQGTGLELSFCKKALDLGFATYVDMSTVAGHKYSRNRSVGCMDFLAFDSVFDWTHRHWKIARGGAVHEQR